MYSCIYGCPMDNLKTKQELLEHYDNIHEKTDPLWDMSFFTHVLVQKLPVLEDCALAHKE